jgi:hypothetical protein
MKKNKKFDAESQLSHLPMKLPKFLTSITYKFSTLVFELVPVLEWETTCPCKVKNKAPYQWLSISAAMITALWKRYT